MALREDSTSRAHSPSSAPTLSPPPSPNLLEESEESDNEDEYKPSTSNASTLSQPLSSNILEESDNKDELD